MPADIHTILFDLDGLVLDTETTYFAAWRQTASAMGYHFSEAFCRSLSGLQYGAVERKIIECCGADFDLAEFNRLSGIFWRDFAESHGIGIKPGFHEWLKLIRQRQLSYALATNSRLHNALECLELSGLAEVFPVIVARDHVDRGKPAPDVFRVAAAQLQADIRRCLVLEDSPAGIVAAKAAGAVTVFVPSILPPDREAVARADRIYPDLTEAARWFRLNSIEAAE